MRTPGHDRELAAGFLVTEGLLKRRDDLLDIVRCGAAQPEEGESAENVLDVVLAPGVVVDLERLTRHVFTSSSCGICSRASIDAVHAQFPPVAVPLSPRRSMLAGLPERLGAAQKGFAATGGLHASALFDADGRLDVVREDVGRHNALDKVIGQGFFADRLPLSDRILLVSGRVSFELMQKALAAGIPCVAAISAPTTAAVEFAQASGQTLVGFLRGDRMNVYAGTLAE
jgi:FdhD protein